MCRTGETLCALLLCLTMLVGCGVTRKASLVFKVSTGDRIKVSLDSTNHYELVKADSGFEVKKGNTTILQGIFVAGSVYQQYVDLVILQDGVTINRQMETEEISFLSYSFVGEAGMESNYIVFVAGSNTGVIIGSLAELFEADEAFDRLLFLKIED